MLQHNIRYIVIYFAADYAVAARRRMVADRQTNNRASRNGCARLTKGNV